MFNNFLWANSFFPYDFNLSSQGVTLNDQMWLLLQANPTLLPVNFSRPLFALPTDHITSSQPDGERKRKSSLVEAQVADFREKNKVYMVDGAKKRWNGKRFVRCCVVDECAKMRQASTLYCKSHLIAMEAKKAEEEQRKLDELEAETVTSEQSEDGEATVQG